MTDTVHVTKINESFLRVECEAGIAYELSEYFTFRVPGYQFTRQYKAGYWDGKIRLFHLPRRQIYAGLFHRIEQFCKSRKYDFTFSQDFADTDVCFDEVKTFLESLGLPKDKTPREYQLKAFVKSIRKGRILLLSPTASGKSLIIYLLARWYNKKTLVIVPTTTLVHQMAGDFRDYGYKQEVHMIKSGAAKESDNMITVSTWQSIYKQPIEWFNQFEVVVGDEAHGCVAKSLTGIMEKLVNTKHRFGTTGTLDDSQTHKLVLEGHFGQVLPVIETHELMKQGHVADLEIKAIVLKYSDRLCQLMKDAKYKDEIAWLVTHERRNKFIKNLVKSLTGNTLVLFHYKAHGKVLREMLEGSSKPIYFIDGDIEGEDRNDIRKLVNEQEQCILLASMKTTSTGINIPNINNLVFVHPSKSKISNLQAIGRSLRKSARKINATLYDIADDLQWKKKKNFTLQHFLERIRIYTEQKFTYRIYTVEIKDDNAQA